MLAVVPSALGFGPTGVWMTEVGAGSGELDLERADFGEAAAPSACVSCRSTPEGAYYTLNGAVVCTRCAPAVGAWLHGTSGAKGYAMAVLYGSVAAVAGAVGMAAITLATGYQLGIVAIGVGWLVGKAVRLGSEQRGGRGYQVIAVLLTYLAASMMYLPMVFEGVRGEDAGAGAAMTAVQVVIAAAISVAVPVWSAMEDPLGLVIVGIALWQAWSMTAALAVALEGPFALRPVAGTQAGT